MNFEQKFRLVMKFLRVLHFDHLFLFCLKFTNYTLLWAQKDTIKKKKIENKKKML